MRAAALVFCVFLVGCVTPPPVPETARERYAAAESSYRAALNTVGSLTDAGIIKKGTDTARNVAGAIRTARAGLNAWGAAPDSQSAEIAASGALSSLQTILVELRARQ